MGPRLAFVLHNGQILVVPGLRGHPGGGLTSLSSAGRGGICAGGPQRGGQRPRAGPGCTPVLSPAACAGGRTSTDAARPGDVSRPVPSREGVRRAASPARPAGEESACPQGRVEGGAGTFSRPRCRPRPPPQESAPRFVSFCFVPVALRGSTPCVASQCGSGFVSGLLPFHSGCPSHVSGCGVAPAFPTLRYQNCGFKSYNFIYYLTTKIINNSWFHSSLADRCFWIHLCRAGFPQVAEHLEG